MDLVEVQSIDLVLVFFPKCGSMAMDDEIPLFIGVGRGLSG